MTRTRQVVRSLVPVLAAIGGMSASAAAQQIAPPVDIPAPEPADTPGAGLSLALGLGAGYAPDYEGSDDYQPVPLWNLRAGNLYHPDTFVQLLGPRLRSNLLPSEHWRLGLSGQYIPERDDVDDDPVDELDKVDASFLLGVAGGYDFLAGPARDFGIELDARQDVGGDNGFLGTVRVFSAGALGEAVRLGVSVETTYASEDYMSSYFDVDADDAADSGLDRFDADSGLKDAAVGVSLTYRLAPSWSVSVLGRYARLLEDAADSPVVDDRGDENQLAAGVLASFLF